jgi:hypothetical protein
MPEMRRYGERSRVGTGEAFVQSSSTGAASYRIQIGDDEGKGDDENVGERLVENEDGG